MRLKGVIPEQPTQLTLKSIKYPPISRGCIWETKIDNANHYHLLLSEYAPRQYS